MSFSAALVTAPGAPGAVQGAAAAGVDTPGVLLKPYALYAYTRTAYGVPVRRPAITASHGAATQSPLPCVSGSTSTCCAAPGSATGAHSTTYLDTGAPPSLSGARHVVRNEVPDATSSTTSVGTSGTCGGGASAAGVLARHSAAPSAFTGATTAVTRRPTGRPVIV